MNYSQQSLRLHKKVKGKVAIKPTVPLNNRHDLTLAYTPGVAAVARLIHVKPSAVFEYTGKANAVAVVTDGSAVLGLGNIGPEAALPVMEGKAILLKKFGRVDAYPICLRSQDTEEIIRTIQLISVGFGGILLEDIAAPRCFEIERRLQQSLDIPVMHDDQHGAAIVILAALINALRVVKKNHQAVRIVINGAGAAAMATTHLLLTYGVPGKNILMVDSHGIIVRGRKQLTAHKKTIAARTNRQRLRGGLAEALVGADVFIGVSAANMLPSAWVATMADRPVVFAMANPDPEISFAHARRTKIKVFGTGRSDYPNQINNLLAFPGVFRGALDARAKNITPKMKMAAALAIAGLVSRSKLSAKYIIPRPFDRRVARVVAAAVRRAA